MDITPIKTSKGYTGEMSAILYDQEERTWVGKCVLHGCTYSDRHTYDIVPLKDITPNHKD